MDLYDDLDTKQRAGQIDGWSSGVKLLQTQLALKKVTAPPVVKKEIPKRPTLLAPTTLLKAKKPTSDGEEPYKTETVIHKPVTKVQTTITTTPIPPLNKVVNDYDWDVIDEYDPFWPNEYEKLVKERREKDRQRDRDRDRKRHGGNRYGDSPSNKYSGFAGRSDDGENFGRSSPDRRVAGAAIAPPPSLQESTPIIPPQNSNVTVPYGSSSVAAKIMAKYGFKDGQGLGKQEQGMSIALQVEKTSKRGGRIIHEKELIAQQPIAQPSPPSASQATGASKEEPSITEIMKSPSKVVLLRNMVGAGDVDSELEGEVKDECNSKYGEVLTVTIKEVANVLPEEAVRIFVEFRRIESAIKAVVDLNGRFFGGRQVKAGFFPFEKYQAKIFTD